ncbi:MAG: DNA/RNA nuclease SfsA, partial [Armatimonadetes bacterium]|nr:DNA/RNA nuclease SfsA [Armatimonadota bacterium]
MSGHLIDRPNRYLARVALPGQVVEVHVPNPGRMHELMLPGRPVQITPAAGPQRKTAFDLQAVWHEQTWVCIDNRLGGRLARLVLEQHLLAELEPYHQVLAEVRCGASRLDFLLHGSPHCWVEAKSCTLLINGCGRFPDAPTVRGRRHLDELIARRQLGDRAAVLFVVQRPDALRLGPHDLTDPEFGVALRAAAAAGVALLAVTAAWT